MNLIRIEHRRCQDYDGYTYVLAPADWDDEQINARIDAAQDAYLAQLAAALRMPERPGYPGSVPRLSDYPDDMTVAEMTALHQAKIDAHVAWEAEYRKGMRGFDDFLADQGFMNLWASEALIEEYICDWGHNHGTQIEHGETVLDVIPSVNTMADR